MLLAHYRMNGDAKDSVKGQDGTATDVDWVDGKIGGAADFNGTSSEINTNERFDFLARGQFSVSFWLNPRDMSDKAGAAAGLVGKGHFFDNVWDVYIRNTHAVVFECIGDPTRVGRVTLGSTFLPLSTWSHISCTYNNGRMKIYINGELNNSATYSPESGDFTNSRKTLIGKRSGDSTRILRGMMDDVRIYDHALSQKEVGQLYRALAIYYPFSSDVGTEGIITDSSAQGIDLQLNPSTAPTWIKDSPVGVGAYRFNGTSQYLVNDIGFYSGHRSYSLWVRLADVVHDVDIILQQPLSSFPSTGVQIFLSDAVGQGGLVFSSRDSSGGYIDAGSIIIAKEEWYHCVLVISDTQLQSFVNGNLIETTTGTFDDVFIGDLSLGARVSGARASACDVASLRVYNSILTETEVKELYQQRASLDDQGSFHAPAFNDTGIRQKLNLNYTQWVDGGVGSVWMFSRNGSHNENYRVIDTDPWGKETVVWEARPEGDNNADGGWNSTYFSDIDSSTLYRFSTWVRRTVIGDGRFYLGCNGSPDVLNRSNGNSVGNPYFWSGGITSTDWILVVGHVWPEGSGTGNDHPDSGRYRVDGKFANIHTDFVFAEGTTSIRHRAYLFYSTDTSTRQQFAYPRMDKCDGTEPSIQELLAGFDSRNEPYFREKSGAVPGFSIREQSVGNFSEIGPAKNLEGFYPLLKDARDLSGKGNDGEITGGAITGDGFDSSGFEEVFLGTDALFLPNNTPFTASGWVFLRTLTIRDMLLSRNNAGGAGPYAWLLGIKDDGAHIAAYDGSAWRQASFPFTTNRWYHLVYVFDGSVVNFYVDGLKVAGDIGWSFSDDPSYTTKIGGYATAEHGVNGIVRDVRFQTTTLTDEEVNILYEMTNPDSATKMKQTATTLYVKGQFKEV